MSGATMPVWIRYKRGLMSAIPVLAVCAVFCGVALGNSTATQDNSPKAETAPGGAIARVGQRILTQSSLELHTGSQPPGGLMEPSNDESAAVLDRLLEQTLFAEEARSVGLDKDATVQAMTEDTVDRLLASLYVRRQVLSTVQVNEAELEEYYAAHRETWHQPETIRARHILLRVDPLATAQEVQAVEARALEIRKRIESGEDFAVLASQYSEDTGTKANGGDLGFFTRQGKVTAISDAAFTMQPGQTGQPVRSSVGYHIVQTLEQHPPGIKPLNEVRGQIRAYLLREKQREAALTERRRLEKKYDLYVDEKFRIKGGGDASKE